MTKIKNLEIYENILIIVDMVNGFVEEGVLHDKEIKSVIPRQIELIKEAHKNGSLIIFIKDMVTKTEYDYSIAFLGDYSLTEEDSQALQTWFQEHGEDLNGDGEVHVQLSDYSCPDEDEDGFDPQVFAAMQTRFIVDVQEGTSMIFFLNQEKYEDYKDEGVFPENLEDYTPIQDCQGYKDAGSPQSAGEYMVTLRMRGEESGLSEDEETQEYYSANEKLLREFIGE